MRKKDETFPRFYQESRNLTVSLVGNKHSDDKDRPLPGQADAEATGPAALERRASSSLTRPWSASGAGSTPRRVKRSASEAKHRSAPSAT